MVADSTVFVSLQQANSVGAASIAADEWRASGKFSLELKALLPSKSFGGGTSVLNSLENLRRCRLPTDDEIGIVVDSAGFKVVDKLPSSDTLLIGVLDNNRIVRAND